MANVRFEIKRDDRIAEFGELCDLETQLVMGEAVRIRKLAVERNAPSDQGVFGQSIEGGVAREGNAITRGDVYSTDDAVKVAVIENGLGPGHFPALGEIQDWADRKHLPVFLVARGIARKGIRARKVFQRSVDETEADVQKLLVEELPSRVVNRL